MTNDEAIRCLNILLTNLNHVPTSESILMTKIAIRTGICALHLQTDRRWILVSDRVPEDDRLVIVCTESGQVYTDYYFDDQSDYWRLAHIIAWQDLPRAYKKEDSE